MADMFMNAGPQSLLPFLDPQAIAQNQADMARFQQNQGLINAVMGQQYVPNSGRAGVFGNVLSHIMGALAQSKQNDKLSDILAQQFQISNAAAQAQRQQQLADEQRKLQEDIYKSVTEARGKAQADKEFALLKDTPYGSFNPATGENTIDPAMQQAAIALAGGKAGAEAKARAQYAGAADSAKLGMIQKLMAQPDSPTKTAQLSSLLGEGGMQAMMFGGMGGGGGQGGALGQQGPTGDEFLKTLSPQLAGQVKAISEGRQAPPTSMAMRSPMGQALMAAVSQYDPTFDATNYAARSKTRNAFTAGKEGQMLNSLNTAIGHAGTLLDAANSLGNTDYPAVNSVLNAFSQAGGSEKVGNFNMTRDAVAGEMTKAFRGAGGSEKDIEEMRNNINSSASPEQLRGVIGKSIMLLGSKAQALNDQYKQAFSNQSAPNFADPHAKATLEKLQKAGVDLGPLGEAYGIGGDASAPAAASAKTVVRLGTAPDGSRVAQFSDGTVGPAP